MAAMINEGANVVHEGIALRPLDVDITFIHGYGFPRFRGGPMLYADMIGLPKVVEMMKQYQQNPHDDAKFWEPAPLLAKLAAEGKTFN